METVSLPKPQPPLLATGFDFLWNAVEALEMMRSFINSHTDSETLYYVMAPAIRELRVGLDLIEQAMAVPDVLGGSGDCSA
jgi:hypothetical protein